MADDKLSRRELFSFWRKPPAAKAGGDQPPAPPAPPPLPTLLRPPGAIFEDLFVDRCTHCGKCVEVCPRQAIALLPDEFGRAAGTPAIVARAAPCVVCEGLQCTKACPSGALLRVATFDVQMGTAVVDATRCTTFHGQACAACVTACPVPGALAQDGAGHPAVDASRCIGCGVCENVCPTPMASITVEPAREIARS